MKAEEARGIEPDLSVGVTAVRSQRVRINRWYDRRGASWPSDHSRDIGSRVFEDFLPGRAEDRPG